MSNFSFKPKDAKFFPAILVVLIIGIALLSSWWGTEEGAMETESNTASSTSKDKDVEINSGINGLESSLESRLEYSLSQIKGVGTVEVTVLLATGPKYEYAVNVTTNQKSIDEKDQSGGTRVTTETTEDGQLVVIRSTQSGSETPVIAKEYKPDVQGVLVVAEGAESPRVKSKLLSAVQTVLDLEAHKIDIQPKE